MSLRLLFSLLFFTAQSAFAQSETPNVVDDQGQKQGLWSAKHSNGKLRYKGEFKDNEPVGLFTYFDVHGNLNAEINNRGDSADVTFFHLNKKMMAEGKYYQQQRSGVWKFYDIEEDISSQKYYVKGKENGPARVYYKDGRISRDCSYRNGVKHGQLTDYFPEGKTKFEAVFVDGNPDGKIKHFHTSGGVKIIGYYKIAVQEGTWTYFAPDGKVERYEVYRNGFLKKSFTPEEAKKMKEDQKKIDSTKTPAPGIKEQ